MSKTTFFSLFLSVSYLGRGITSKWLPVFNVLEYNCLHLVIWSYICVYSLNWKSQIHKISSKRFFLAQIHFLDLFLGIQYLLLCISDSLLELLSIPLIFLTNGREREGTPREEGEEREGRGYVAMSAQALKKLNMNVIEEHWTSYILFEFLSLCSLLRKYSWQPDSPSWTTSTIILEVTATSISMNF